MDANGARRGSGMGKSGRSRLARAIALCLLAGAASAAPARAASSVWTGAVSDDWSDSANWVVPPANGSFVLIDVLAPHDVHLRTAAAIGTMTIGGQDQGRLAVEAGGSLAVTGGDDYGVGLLLGDGEGSSGTIIVSGAGSTLTVDQAVQIGNGGAGALNVLDGGIAELATHGMFAEIGIGSGYYYGSLGGAGVGHVLVDGDGSALRYAGGINLLNGTFDLRNGGQAVSVTRAEDHDIAPAWVDVIGAGAAGSGEAVASVTGPGSAWTSVNALEIAHGGTGTLQVLGGAIATFAGYASIGNRNVILDAQFHPTGEYAYGSGNLLVSGGGSAFTLDSGENGNGDLVVGVYGTGRMTIDAGGRTAIAGTTVVGDQAGSDGTLDLAGGGTMAVDGYDSSGNGLVVGNVAGSSGAVAVSGTGSALTVDAGTQIGNAGTGSLSVLDGGHASLGLAGDYSEILLGLGHYGWVADSDQGSGSLAVDGNGSILDYAGGLNVLNGTVTVSNGGQVASHFRGSAFWIDLIGWGVPANPDPAAGFAGLRGTGMVTIEGEGSAWNSVNGLHMGDGGAGWLSILDGGKATFSGFAELGGISYLYDAVNGMPVPGLAGQTGSGTVLVSGAGSALTMTATPGSAGYINVGITGHGALRVNQGGVVTAPGGIRVGGSNQSSIVVGGMLGGVLAAPGSLATPGVALLDPSSTLVFAHNATSYDFAPVISGVGVIDVAHGFTKLTGDSSAFAGDTTIASGATLSVDGSLGGDISVDGRLQGTGAVGNVIVNDGGTLAPGNSPGTLHVDGDLVMQAGSTYAAELDSDTGASDSVMVEGDVTIQSGVVLSVSNLGAAPLTPGASLQLIQTVGVGSTVVGQFDSVVGGSELLDFGVSYEGGQILVAADRSATMTFASLAGAGFGGLGEALDGIPDDSILTRLIFSQVTTAAAAQALMNDMAGTIHADLRRVLLEDSRYPRAAIGDRLRDDDAFGGVGWVRLTGGSASAGGDGALPGADVDQRGMMAGYDMAIGDSRMGVAVAAGKGSYAADGKGSSAELRDRNVALYGRSAAGRLRLGYGIAFGSTDVDATRDFAIGSAAQHLESSRTARTAQAFLDAGYRIGGGNAFRYLEPFLNMAHVRVQDDDMAETGSVAALAVEGGTTRATFGTLGLRWSARVGDGDIAGSLGWRHAFGLDHALAREAFVAGGPAFTIDSLPVDDAVLVELGVKVKVSPRARAWFGYDGMFAGSARDNGLKLQLNIDL